MKISLCCVVIMVNFCRLWGQCTPTVTDSSVHNPVCSDQWTLPYNSAVVKIGFTSITIGNTYTFSTVGETATGDTYMTLYDAAGNILETNDDDTKCNGCKQSTIKYTNTTSTNFFNPYIILSKPSCTSLDFEVPIKYNVRNSYNNEPVITSPEISFTICGGTTVQFEAINTSTENPIWKSMDTSIATIDGDGKATFLKSGIAKVELKGAFGCVVLNNYLVKIGTVTSVITPN